MALRGHWTPEFGAGDNSPLLPKTSVAGQWIMIADATWDSYVIQAASSGAWALFTWGDSIDLADGEEWFFEWERIITLWSTAAASIWYTLNPGGRNFTSTASYVYLNLSSAGALSLTIHDKNNNSSSSGTLYTISVSTAYQVGISVKRYNDGGTWKIDAKLYIDGVQQGATLTHTISGADTTFTFAELELQAASVGKGGLVIEKAHEVRGDDSQLPFAAYTIVRERLAPDGNGATNEWRNDDDSGAADYSAVDDAAGSYAEGAGEEIQSTSTTAAKEFQVTMAAPSGPDSDDTIHGIVVYHRHGTADAGTGAGATGWQYIAISDGTDTIEKEAKYHKQTAHGPVFFQTAPDGGAWTLTDLNNLRVALRKKATANAIQWKNAMIAVDVIYEVVTAAPASRDRPPLRGVMRGVLRGV